MVDRLLVSSNIPSQFRRTYYEDYDTERGHIDILKDLKEWEPTAARPLALFYGRPGKAKTMMACAALNEFQDRWHVPSNVPDSCLTVLRQERWPIYFIQMAELVALHLRSMRLEGLVTKGLKDPAEYLEIDQLLQDLEGRVEALVIDDVGKEHRTSTGYAEDVFDLLVRTRHNKGLLTVLTSNLPITRWSGEYSDSMESLVRRSALVLEF